MTQRIGVLALQGGYALHQQVLQSFSVEAPLIFKPEQLEGLDGLVIPGGESTALLKLMTPLSWQSAICDFKARGKKILGTCAGMILLAQAVEPAQESLQLIDITVSRNAYGRQLESHVAVGECDQRLGVATLEMVFIRAPKIVRCGKNVDVLATCSGVPVLVQQDRVVCASFHPEMLLHGIVYKYFLNL